MATQMRSGVPTGWKKPDTVPSVSLEYSSTDILNSAQYDSNSNSDGASSNSTSRSRSAPSNAPKSRSQYDAATSSSGEYYDAPSSLSDNTTPSEAGANAKANQNRHAKPPVRPRPSGAQLEAVNRRFGTATDASAPSTNANASQANAKSDAEPNLKVKPTGTNSNVAVNANVNASGQNQNQQSSYVRLLLQKYETGPEKTESGKQQTGPLTESGIESDLSHYDDTYRRAQVGAASSNGNLQNGAPNAVASTTESKASFGKPSATATASLDATKSATQQVASAASHNGMPSALSNTNSSSNSSGNTLSSSNAALPPASQHPRPSGPHSKRKRATNNWRRRNRRIPLHNATDTETNIDEYDDDETMYDSEESEDLNSSGSDLDDPRGAASPSADYAPPTVALSELGRHSSSASSASSSTLASPTSSANPVKAGLSPVQQLPTKQKVAGESSVSPNSLRNNSDSSVSNTSTNTNSSPAKASEKTKGDDRAATSSRSHTGASMLRDLERDDDDELETFDCSPKSRRRLASTNAPPPPPVTNQQTVAPKQNEEQLRPTASSVPLTEPFQDLPTGEQPVVAVASSSENEQPAATKTRKTGTKAKANRANQPKAKVKTKAKAKAQSTVPQEAAPVDNTPSDADAPRPMDTSATPAVPPPTVNNEASSIAMPTESALPEPEAYVNHQEAARLLQELKGARPRNEAPIYANTAVTRPISSSAPRGQPVQSLAERREQPSYCPPDQQVNSSTAPKLSSSMPRPQSFSKSPATPAQDSAATSALRAADVIRLFEQQAATSSNTNGSSVDATQKTQKASITKSISSTVRRLSVGFGLSTPARSPNEAASQADAPAQLSTNDPSQSGESTFQRDGSRRSSKSKKNAAASSKKKNSKSVGQLNFDSIDFDSASASGVSIDSRSSKKRRSFRLSFRASKDKKPETTSTGKLTAMSISGPMSTAGTTNASADELEDSGTLVGDADDDSFTDDEEELHGGTMMQQRTKLRNSLTEVVPIRTVQSPTTTSTSRSMHNLATLSPPKTIPLPVSVMPEKTPLATHTANDDQEPGPSTFRRARSEHHIQRPPAFDSLTDVLNEASRARASLRKTPPTFKPPPPPVSPPLPTSTRPASPPLEPPPPIPSEPPVIPAVRLLTPGSTMQTLRNTLKQPPPVAAKPRISQPQVQTQPQAKPQSQLLSDRPPKRPSPRNSFNGQSPATPASPPLRAPLFDFAADLNDPAVRFLSHVYVNTTGGGVANWKYSCVENPTKMRQPLPPPPPPAPDGDEPAYDELNAEMALVSAVTAPAPQRASVRRTKRRANAGHGEVPSMTTSLAGSNVSLNENEATMHERLVASLQRFSTSRAPSVTTLASVPDVRALNKDDLESLVVTYLNDRKREKMRNVLSALLREDPNSEKISTLMSKYESEIFELLDATNVSRSMSSSSRFSQPALNRNSTSTDDPDMSPFDNAAALNGSSLTLDQRQRAAFAFSTMRYSGRFGPPNATYANEQPANSAFAGPGQGPGRRLTQSRTALSSVSLASTLTLTPANRHHPPAAPSLAAMPVAIDLDNVVVLQATGEPDEPPPLLGETPKPTPPTSKRANLFESAADRFAELDKHAIAIAARNDLCTFTLLVGELIRPALDEVERVRAIWRYVTTKDLFNVEFEGEPHADSLLDLLRAVKIGVSSLNDLFRRMVQYAGIHCVTIEGYSKGAGYSPGVNLKANRTFRNQWTAVYVDKQWRFCNAAWGSRYLLRSYKLRSQAFTAGQSPTESETAAMRFPFRCDEFYFLTDPNWHVYEHYPDKKEWTLLKRSAAVSFESFVQLPILKSNFFNAGLSLLQKDITDTLETHDGRIRISIGMPRYVGITCTLLQREDMVEVRGVTLARLLSTNECIITCEPPKIGRYFLNVYVSENWKQDAFLARTSGFELGCSFLIRCPEPNTARLTLGRFPPTIGMLGKTPVADRLGLVCAKELTDPYIVSNDRSAVELKLVVLPGLKVQHKMTYFDRSGTQMQQCDQFALLQTTEPQRNQAKYVVRCPSEGLYLLTVYAALVFAGEEQELDAQNAREQELECAWRFLIDARRAMRHAQPFPKQTSRWFGSMLHEPTSRRLAVDSRYLFRVTAPHCRTVSAVINGRTWLDLRPAGHGEFEARIQTGSEKGELAVYGKIREDPTDRSTPRRNPAQNEPLDDDKFVKLLEYEIVDRASAAANRN